MIVETESIASGGLSFWGTQTVTIKPRSGDFFILHDTGGMGPSATYSIHSQQEYFSRTTFALIRSETTDKLYALTQWGKQDQWITYSLNETGRFVEIILYGLGLALVGGDKLPLNIILHHRRLHNGVDAWWPYPSGTSATDLVLGTGQVASFYKMCAKDLSPNWIPFHLRIREGKAWLAPPQELETDFRIKDFDSAHLSVKNGTELVLPAWNMGGIKIIPPGLTLECFHPAFAEYLRSRAPRADNISDDTAKIMVVGQTGVGKSSTINALAGKRLAKVSDFEPETIQVQSYEIKAGKTTLTLFDTPGFADDLPEIGNDDAYIQMIRTHINQIGCLVYVTRLDDTRLRNDEKSTIKLLSESLGADIWKYAVLVFTMADKVGEKFRYHLENRSRLIINEISKYYPGANPSTIATSNDGHTGVAQSLPDGSDWKGELIAQVIGKSKGSQALVILENYAREVRGHNREKIKFSNEQKETIKTKIESEGLFAKIAKWIFDIFLLN